MAETIVSDAQVFPQDPGTGAPSLSDGKFTSGAYFSALARYKGDGSYVGEDEDGNATMQFTVDTANNNVDVGAGYCYIIQDNTDVQGDAQSGYDTTVPVGVPHVVILPTAQTDLALGTDTDNDVYISFDPTTSDDTVTIHHGGAILAPSDPYVKLGTANTSTGATTRPNDLATSTQSDLDLVGNLGLNGNYINGVNDLYAESGINLNIITGGTGGDSVGFYDGANSQNILSGLEGGDVLIPNGDLNLSGNAVDLGGGNLLELNTITGDATDQTTLNMSGFRFRIIDGGTDVLFTETSGDVEIPTGDLGVGSINANYVYPDFRINTDGTGGDTLGFYDRANTQDIAVFKAGGDVEIPNGLLNMNGNYITNVNNITGTSGLNMLLASGGSGSDSVNLYDAANSQTLLSAAEGGNVYIQNGALVLNGLKLDSGHLFSQQAATKLITNGSGTDTIEIEDSANSFQSLAIFNEGGNVEIPNGSLDLNGNTLTGVRSSSTSLTATDLSNGEIAIEEAGGRLVWKDGAGTAYYVDGTAL